MTSLVPGDWAHLPPAPDVVQMEVGLLQNFCTILFCPDTRKAAVVDPAWEVDRLLGEARRLDLAIDLVLVTHTHNDHIEGVAEMVAATGAKVAVHPAEVERVRAAAAAGLLLVKDRLDIPIGRTGVRALETPGHTVGGTCYLAGGYVVTGDVLFVGGCGRTDFSGGSTSALWASLSRLMDLPEETRVYPGHDYGTTKTSTIGREIRENPYVCAGGFEAFRSLCERPRRG